MRNHTSVYGLGTAEEFRVFMLGHFGAHRRFVELMANDAEGLNGYRLSAPAAASLSRALDDVEACLRCADVERVGALDGVPEAVAQCIAQASYRSVRRE